MYVFYTLPKAFFVRPVANINPFFTHAWINFRHDFWSLLWPLNLPAVTPLTCVHSFCNCNFTLIGLIFIVLHLYQRNESSWHTASTAYYIQNSTFKLVDIFFLCKNTAWQRINFLASVSLLHCVVSLNKGFDAMRSFKCS